MFSCKRKRFQKIYKAISKEVSLIFGHMNRDGNCVMLTGFFKSVLQDGAKSRASGFTYCRDNLQFKEPQKKVSRQSGQVDLLLEVNHLYKQAEWNFFLHVLQAFLGRE